MAVFVALLAVDARAQGQFVFNNRVTSDGINARFFAPGDSSEISSVGAPDYIVHLYGRAASSPVAEFTPLDPPTTTFQGAAGTALAGYVVPVKATVPDAAIGEDAWILVDVSGPWGGRLGPYRVSLGGGNIPTPHLPLGDVPVMLLIVPEPSPFLLALLGVGVVSRWRGAGRAVPDLQ